MFSAKNLKSPIADYTIGGAEFPLKTSARLKCLYLLERLNSELLADPVEVID
jgi:hypothetical protein